MKINLTFKEVVILRNTLDSTTEKEYKYLKWKIEKLYNTFIKNER